MFGTDSDKNNPAPAAPATSSPTGTAPLIEPTSTADPVPPPNTTIAPAPAPAPVPNQTAPYLEMPKPESNSTPGSTSFLTSGSAASKPVSGTPAMPTPVAIPPEGSDELMKIKQQALQNLAPLIDKLDQPPEERFKTLMMMIRASDNPQYLDEAYGAANGIKDEKQKAQALLDVVNEINYFTQNKTGENKT